MDERTQKLVDIYKAQGPLSTGQIGEVIATTPAPTAITANSLQPVQPINLPQPQISTTADRAMGGTTALLELEELKQKAAQKRADEEAKLRETESKQSSLLEKIGLSKKEITTKGREEFGLDPLEKQRREALNTLKTSQVQELAELKALESQGLVGTGSINAQSGIKRKYGMEQLEAQLSYHLANDDIVAAEKTIADRITLETEPLYAQLDLTEKVYEQIKTSLSTAERNEWTAVTDTIKQQIKETEELTKYKGEIAKTASLNGVPLNSYTQMKINRANSIDEINQVLADDGVSLAKPASGGGGGFDGTEYASDLDAIIGATLSTIPSKFGQQTFRDQISRARNDADKISLVAAQVLKGQPAEFKNDFRNQAVGISMIDKAIAELDNGTQTGAIQAGKQYAANFFGKDYDPALAKIEGYITSAIQPYRNSVTGAAWGEQEDTEYASLFGSTKYSPAELRQRLLQTKELLKSKSAEGLNTFVNPLGYYENEFQTGALTPDTVDEPETEAVKSFWGKAGDWLFGDE